MEIWKEIEITKGDYSASSRGNIRGNKRLGADGRRLPEKILKPYCNGTGYLLVTLMQDGVKTKYLVSRLVYCTFKGLGMDYPFDVHHIDHDKSNNSLKNLEELTRSENIKKSWEHNNRMGNKKRPLQGAKNLEKAWKKTSKAIDQFTLEGVFIARYPAANQAATQLGYEVSAICRCANGTQKTSYGYKWIWVKENKL